VRFLGLYVSETNDCYIVTEFIESGNLQVLLQNQGTIDAISVIKIAKQITSGMRYLGENSIVHRDLALRNILAEVKSDSFMIKLSDFGLSREVKETYYFGTTSTKFPVKWSSPEVLKWRKYSAKSDIYAFGIVLWEILECGKEPYGDMSNTEACDAVLEGYRLPKPSNCPDRLYKLMTQCWQKEPKDRPSFEEIYDELEGILEAMKEETEFPTGSIHEEANENESEEKKLVIQQPEEPEEDHYNRAKRKTAEAIKKILESKNTKIMNANKFEQLR